MSENTGARPGDLGRRVALRRERLGLTREQVAERAGMSPHFLRYVEERPAEAGTGTLMRLAGALRMPVDELLGGGAQAPPGGGPAARRPELVTLAPDECRDLLSDRGVGRVAVVTPQGPEVFPVNYAVAHDVVLYRTEPRAGPAVGPGTQVAFEVDRIDDALSQGWSVLVVGSASPVSESEARRLLGGRPPPEPWAGGERDVWVRVEPQRVSGRRILVA
ncbi:hypothetical protein GCM10027168_49290 [Streptomyces capparidis]